VVEDIGPEDRKIIGEDIKIKDVEFSWRIGMPLVRSLGEGLWEVRSNLNGGRIARMIFAVGQKTMVLLHGFVKKTQIRRERPLQCRPR